MMMKNKILISLVEKKINFTYKIGHCVCNYAKGNIGITLRLYIYVESMCVKLMYAIYLYLYI